jgi:hypothetical protein
MLAQYSYQLLLIWLAGYAAVSVVFLGSSLALQTQARIAYSVEPKRTFVLFEST